MCEIDYLIEFLEKKAWSSNQTMHVSLLNYNLCKKYLSPSKLAEKSSKELAKVLDKQVETNQIISIINDLALIRKKLSGQNIDLLNLELNKYFNFHILLIVKGNKAFGKKHPFYGYKVFHEKLIKYFVEKEEYEICSQLKSEIDQIA